MAKKKASIKAKLSVSKAKPKAKVAKRASEKNLKRKYEGATKSKRFSRWNVADTSANAETEQGLPTLRARARDLRRNNPYATKGIQVITSNVVGTGIVTQFRGPNAEKLEQEWSNWAEKVAIDFDGRSNIYGLQSLIMDATAESGECLIRKRYTADLQYPLQYQVLEADFLDTSKNEPKNSDGSFIVQGIQFDAQGKRLGYWLYETHPGGYDVFKTGSNINSNFVSASDLYHVFRMDRPGQARGVTWMAPIIVRLKDFDDYEDAQLVRQKIAACFTAFVRDISADFLSDDQVENGTDDGVAISERLEPALIEELPRGKMIEFANPPAVQNYGEYTTTVLRAIAAGLGITYESLTGDYSNVNFSSGRMGWLEFNRNVKAWQERIIQLHVLDPIARDFMVMMQLKGVKSAGIDFVHVAPAREMIDPTREVPMKIEEIRSGLTTLSDAIMERGKDPAAQFTQYKKDLDALDAKGIKLTSDPRVELSAKGKNKVVGELDAPAAKEKSNAN